MSRDLSFLTPNFRDAISRVLSQCFELGIEIRPYQTIRDLWEQARLWRQSRPAEEIRAAIRRLEQNGAPFLAHVLESVEVQSGRRVTNALPGLSWHQWGEAVDCYWHLNNVAEWDTQKTVMISDGREINGYRLYGEIARSHGLTSGGFWIDLKDWVHVQLREESKNGRLYLNGREFKFVGVNIRGLVHYGHHYSHGRGMPHDIINADPQVRAQLSLVDGFGARMVRIFLANRHAETEEIIARLKHLINSIQQLGLKNLFLLPALTDYYADVPFHVRGDEDFYQPVLNAAWYRTGWQANYEGFVEAV